MLFILVLRMWSLGPEIVYTYRQIGMYLRDWLDLVGINTKHFLNAVTYVMITNTAGAVREMQQ